MRLFILSVLAVVSSTIAHQEYRNHSDYDLDLWELFKIEHEKTFLSPEEENTRRNVFLNNLEFIRDHNAKYAKGEATFTLGVNHLADMTKREVVERMTGFRLADRNVTGEMYWPDLSQKLPKTLDWRLKGAVTPVKDQGLCGSCWAFSAIGSIEGAWFIKSRQLVSLSEQNLLDCTGAKDSCGGGDPPVALQYVVQNKGVDTERAYPYQGVKGECRYNPSGSTAQITGHGTLTSGDEEALRNVLVNKGPISIAIAATDYFQAYRSGLFMDSTCAGHGLNHAVLLVGYGTLNGQDYWLVKNSWGTSWGMNGYIMMARNKGNMCGIASYANFPQV